MINTNLIVSINEDAIGGDPSAINIKTTNLGNIIVEMSCPKVAIKIADLEDALLSIKEFLGNRKIDVTETKETQQPSFEFQYESDAV
jgi:hypothetical protein